MFRWLIGSLILGGLLAQLGTVVADDDGGFRDCKECPEMVVLPSGSFVMGSTESDSGSQPKERPRHEVDIQSFALGKYEITFAEWDACVSDGGCDHEPDDQGWGRGSRPVVNVNWKDAKQYVAWLSGRTGEVYRLPSESEWEYAARAGTTTQYAFGDDITEAQANFGSIFGRTTDAGSYPPNAWGLHDMHGNVREWVEDVYNTSYEGAPSDGSPWLDGNEGKRTIRSGSWNYSPDIMRSAYRDHHPQARRAFDLGFRVARSLSP